MKPTAIVYVSHTGYTARYARLLSQMTGLPCHTLPAAKTLPKGTPVIYLGWLMAGTVKDYRKAKRRLDIRCVCGVGLGDTGGQDAQARKSSRIPEEIPVFTLQGGMDHSKLSGVYASMIGTLTRVMAAKKNRTEDEEKMLRLLRTGGDFVSGEQLMPVLRWFGSP